MYSNVTDYHKEIEIVRLATEINEFMLDVDPYGYMNMIGEDGDNFETVTECILDMAKMISEKNDSLIEQLQNIVEDDGDRECREFLSRIRNIQQTK